jgi:hypothetical protein
LKDSIIEEKNMTKHSSLLIPVILFAAGCNSAGPATSPAKGEVPASKYLAATEPAGARGVLEVRKDARDGDEVTIVGRIGGSRKPFVAGRASFTIVDPSLVPCSDREGDSCPTPWDYCCDPKDKLAQATASIKFVDDRGKTIEQDAPALLGVKELQTIVVRGKARRDEGGNLIVLAEQIYIKR